MGEHGATDLHEQEIMPMKEILDEIANAENSIYYPNNDNVRNSTTTLINAANKFIAAGKINTMDIIELSELVLRVQQKLSVQYNQLQEFRSSRELTEAEIEEIEEIVKSRQYTNGARSQLRRFVLADDNIAYNMNDINNIIGASRGRFVTDDTINNIQQQPMSMIEDILTDANFISTNYEFTEMPMHTLATSISRIVVDLVLDHDIYQVGTKKLIRRVTPEMEEQRDVYFKQIYSTIMNAKQNTVKISDDHQAILNDYQFISTKQGYPDDSEMWTSVVQEHSHDRDAVERMSALVKSLDHVEFIVRHLEGMLKGTYSRSP